MSNEESITPEASSWGAFGDGSATTLSFISATNYVLAPHGSPIWQGSADELAALVRDARRFRKLSALTFGCDHMIGMSRRKDDHMLVWGDGKTLAEIADALPDPTSDSASGTPPQG